MPTSRRPALLSLPPARPAASRTRAPNSPHVCPSHCTDQRGGPNASTDADQLVARRSSDSAMDGGREERPEAAEASPNPPSIMPKQPGSGQPLGQLVEAADRSSAGKCPGEAVRGAGPARSQQATAGSGQSPWSRLSATSTQFLAASATTVVTCKRSRAVQHRAETQVGRQAAIPTRGAARGQGVVEGA